MLKYLAQFQKFASLYVETSKSFLLSAKVKSGPTNETAATGIVSWSSRAGGFFIKSCCEQFFCIQIISTQNFVFDIFLEHLSDHIKIPSEMDVVLRFKLLVHCLQC